MIGRQLAVLMLSAGVILAPLPAYAAPADGTVAAPAAAPATAPAEANDETREQARQLFINGQRLYAEGSYEAAIIAFKKGYELSQEPAFLYNIANAYERLGEFGQARDYYDQYRVYADEGQQDALSRKIAVLDKRQSEKLAAEQAEKERAAAAAREEERRRQEQIQADQQPKEKVFGPAAWALTATAAVGFGVGIGFGVRANNKRDEALANCVGDTEMRVCGSAAQEAIDARRQAAIAADVGFVVGAVATVALIGVVAAKAAKLKRAKEGDSAAKTTRRPSVAPYAGRSGGGLVLTGRF